MSGPSQFRSVLGLLSRGERYRGALVTLLMIGMAFVETVSVASVMPFLAVLGNPEVVTTNQYLSRVMRLGGFASVDDFLFALGVGAFVVVVAASVFRAVAQHYMLRFVNMRRHTIGMRLLQSYLRQPYEFFLHRNSADLAKTVLSEVDQLIQNIYRPGIQMIAYGAVAIVLSSFLVILDPMLACVVALALTCVYGVVYLSVRPVLGRIGRDRLRANQDRFVAVGEAFGGIKALKILGREQSYIQKFSVPSQAFARYQSLAETLSVTPKFIIEAVGLGGILIMALVLMRSRDDLGDVLPILGLYAFAGYRLLPAAQNIFAGFARLRFGMSNVGELYQELQAARLGGESIASDRCRLRMTKSIRVENLSFRYAESSQDVLRNVTLMIPARTSVAFVGTTGAGKTTLVDIIIGLLRPTSGQVFVDKVELDHSNVRSWQKSIGYVPQETYLSDASIIENIAFGVPKEQIDIQAVKAAAKSANIHDFIENELTDGYDTVVGDRGVRLSGGQKQRLGIARALYHDPDVLVLDEATSALDNETERAIVDVLGYLHHRKTLIMIAHRMSSVRHCQRIYVLEAGELIEDGTYDELVKTSARFQRLASEGRSSAAP